MRLPDFAWLAPPVLVGAVLRLWHLPAQIVGGDELNGVRTALRMPLGKVLTTYQLQDPSLPLAGFYRFLLDRGVGLSELWVRLPVLACGLAALVAIPWAAERRVGRAAAHVLAWLVALSPLLVLYSRIARPYMPIALLGFGATAAFEAWWRTGRAALAAAYVALAGLCVYLHLGSAPFVVAPFSFALGSLVFDRDRRDGEGRPGLGALVAVGLATVGAFLAFLVPAWDSLRVLVGDKHNPLEIRPDTVTGVLRLQSGSASPVVAAAFWAAALLGVVSLLRRDRRLGFYTLVLVAAQVAGLIVLSPEMLVHPMVFNRYLIPALPWILVWAAVGLSTPWRVSRRVQRIAVAAGLAALFLTGPLKSWQFREGSFAQHNDILGFFCPPARISPEAVPRFYRRLSQDTASRQEEPILEHPWFPWWAYTRAYYLYQETHGREVVLSLARPLHGAARLRFRNMVRPRPEELLASRARYLVVHTDLPAEEERVVPHCWPMVEDFKPQHRKQILWAGRSMARRLTQAWGEPDFREPGLLAWDLDRIRGATR